MPRKAPNQFAVWTVLFLPLVVIAVGAMALCGGEAGVAQYFDAWRAANPEAVFWVRLYTDWGNPALYLVYAAMLYRGLARGRADLTARAGAYLAAQLLVSLAIERVLKIGIGRPRPGVGGPYVPFSLDAAHNSMPSGHTVEMTVQTASLAVFARSLALPAALGLALGLMGLSRLAMGAHHPTDLLAGLVVGSLGGVVAKRLSPVLEAGLARVPAFNRPPLGKGL